MPNARHRYLFLDGMRGLAALYVAVFHNVWEYAKNLGAPYGLALGWLRHGNYAVDLFIVLSGFCLMMPVVQSGNLTLRGGLRYFFFRRAKRILPPYFFALFGTWALILFSAEGLSLARHGPVSSDWLLNFHFQNIVSHLLLIHNWDSRWNMSINFPLWSVATEWQIYFIFALLLIPMVKHLGMTATGVGAIFLGLLPLLALPPRRNLYWAAPWLLGLFYIGMFAAFTAFSNSPRPAAIRESVKWSLWGTFASAILVAFQILAPPTLMYNVLEAFIVGAIAACLILSCVRSIHRGRPNWLTRLLETRAIAFLGLISYSLYLTHVPAMFKLFPLMNALHLSPGGGVLFRIAFGIPWMLCVAILFFLAVERRFLNKMVAPGDDSAHALPPPSESVRPEPPLSVRLETKQDFDINKIRGC